MAINLDAIRKRVQEMTGQRKTSSVQLWKPGVWEGDAGLYAWGPPPPPSFLAPEDLAGLMAGAHGAG